MNQVDLQKLQGDIIQASAFIRPLKAEMSRIIAGQTKLIDRLIAAMLSDGHVLLEGLPGLAKTLAVKTLAQALDGAFSRIQFTPDLLPADVVGTSIYNPAEHSFSVKKGPVFANIVLADEINRAPAKVQSSLLECMQEKQATVAGTTFRMPEPFLVLATQNPIEQEGTYPLPEAQIDRFLFKLKIDYPSRDEERIIAERMGHPECDPKAMQAAKLEDITNARKWVDQVYMDEKILDYILDIVWATRPGNRNGLSQRQSGAKLDDIDTMVEVGASPRATIAMAVASKAMAFMEGRAYVIPQDVKSIAHDVLRHRIILSYEAEAENRTQDHIISGILDELKTP